MKVSFRERTIYFLFGVALVIYLVLRAVYVPMAHDELLTFFRYIQTGEFIPYQSFWDTNNHFLNTFLSWCSYSLFGSHPLVLRLPNLLGGILFLYCSYQLLKFISYQPLRIGLIFTLWFSAYFIEFFAMNRGYGLSMGLFTASVYLALKATHTHDIRYYILMPISVGLAVSSNLTLMTSGILLIVYLLIYAIHRCAKSFNTLNLLKVVLPALICGWPMYYWMNYGLELKTRGLLYYGHQKGFWDTTVDSLIVTMFEKFPFPYEYIFIPILLTSLAAFLLWIFRISKNPNLAVMLKKPQSLLTVLLFGNILAIVVMAELMDVLYPADRGALYFIPMFLLMIAFMVDGSNKEKWLSWLFIPLLCIPIHFFETINLSHSSFWQKEHIPAHFHSIVSGDIPKGYKPTISGRFTNQLFWDYMNIRNDIHLPRINENPESAQYADYVFVGPYLELDTYLNQGHFDTLAYDPISSYYLLKRHDFFKRKLIRSVPVQVDGVTKEPKSSYTFFKDSVSQPQPLCLAFDLQLVALTRFHQARLNFASTDEQNNNLVYREFDLGWSDASIKDVVVRFKNNMIIHPASFEVVNTYYLWNKSHSRMALSGKIDVYKLYK